MLTWLALSSADSHRLPITVRHPHVCDRGRAVGRVRASWHAAAGRGLRALRGRVLAAMRAGWTRPDRHGVRKGCALCAHVGIGKQGLLVLTLAPMTLNLPNTSQLASHLVLGA